MTLQGCKRPIFDYPASGAQREDSAVVAVQLQWLYRCLPGLYRSRSPSCRNPHQTSRNQRPMLLHLISIPQLARVKRHLPTGPGLEEVEQHEVLPTEARDEMVLEILYFCVRVRRWRPGDPT